MEITKEQFDFIMQFIKAQQIENTAINDLINELKTEILSLKAKIT